MNRMFYFFIFKNICKKLIYDILMAAELQVKIVGEILEGSATENA